MIAEAIHRPLEVIYRDASGLPEAFDYEGYGIDLKEKAQSFAREWKLPYQELREDFSLQENSVYLEFSQKGIALLADGMRNQGDFETLLPRVLPGRWGAELLVKAARFKKWSKPRAPRALDATAGMGEDALLLAVAGFEVDLMERDPVIAALLEDSLFRARYGKDAYLAELAMRMHLFAGDSTLAMHKVAEALGEMDVEEMREEKRAWDLIYLDPMFPERRKSALIKKKFQLIHQLQAPESKEEELLEAAKEARPKRIVIKRPKKGAELAREKPSHRIDGKAIRYDVIVLPN